MSYINVELWDEPRTLFENEPEFTPMMTKEEHGFLCALIKQKNAEKIVELGVAAGGTTLVIMNALEILNRNSRVYSVDFSEQFYVNTSFRTGYLYDKYKSKMKECNEHVFLLGETVAERIEKSIGDDVEFVILDTTHYLPGEMLDFLCILPYLKDGAIVVLHDIMASRNSSYSLGEERKGISGPYRYICTQLLFSIVKGKKYFNFSTPNIAAFEVNEETRKSAADIFMALDITWGVYEKRILEKYERVIEKKYDEYCQQLFKKAIKDNMFVHMRMISFSLETTKQLENFIEKESVKSACVWGLGNLGEKVIEKLFSSNVKVLGTIDRSGKTYKKLESYAAYQQLPNCDVLILAFQYDEAVHSELMHSEIKFYWVEDLIQIIR